MNLTEEKVRAGHTGDGVRNILGWSLFLGGIGLAVLLALYIV
jgi:hypothetical protein